MKNIAIAIASLMIATRAIGTPTAQHAKAKNPFTLVFAGAIMALSHIKQGML